MLKSLKTCFFNISNNISFFHFAQLQSVSQLSKRYPRSKPFNPVDHKLNEKFLLFNYAVLKGWGCKYPQVKLQNLLPKIGDGSIGKETPDVSIIDIKNTQKKLISTIDFFTPAVAEPYTQGRIACCNVLSDLYCMGVTNIDTILMTLCICTKMTEQEREVVYPIMLQGFNDCAEEAKTTITGGQTIYNPWPIIGGVAIATPDNSEIIMPCNGEEGDVLVLTKPIGTQVLSNVYQWFKNNDKRWHKVKNFITEQELAAVYHRGAESMATLNRNSALLMHKYKAHGSTDVTGFGILGHARNLAEAQKQPLDFIIHTLPILNKMTKIDKKVANFKLKEGLSAETSGGLLIILPKENALNFIKESKEKFDEDSWIIGDVLKGSNRAYLSKEVKYLDII